MACHWAPSHPRQRWPLSRAPQLDGSHRASQSTLLAGLSQSLPKKRRQAVWGTCWHIAGHVFFGQRRQSASQPSKCMFQNPGILGVASGCCAILGLRLGWAVQNRVGIVDPSAQLHLTQVGRQERSRGWFSWWPFSKASACFHDLPRCA